MIRYRDQSTVKDRVCGKVLSKREVVAYRYYNGKIYYFCAQHCCDMFELHPEHYLRRRRSWFKGSRFRTHRTSAAGFRSIMVWLIRGKGSIEATAK